METSKSIHDLPALLQDHSLATLSSFASMLKNKEASQKEEKDAASAADARIPRLGHSFVLFVPFLFSHIAQMMGIKFNPNTLFKCAA